MRYIGVVQSELSCGDRGTFFMFNITKNSKTFSTTSDHQDGFSLPEVLVAASAGVVAPLVSFPCWFWDYNNDGNLDIFASATSGPIEVLALHPFGIGKSTSNDRSTRFLQEKLPIEGDRLYRGDGQGNFADVTQIENVTYPSEPMGANFGDLDNDGWLDFHLATGDVPYAEIRPNVMFVYRPGHGFVNVTMAGGFGHLQKGHGVSFADIDNDGDQDVYVQMGGAYPAD